MTPHNEVMRHSILRRPRSAAHLARYNKALDRIDDYLERTYPEVEEEKIKKVMVLLFGEEPENTTFQPTPAPDEETDFNPTQPTP